LVYLVLGLGGEDRRVQPGPAGYLHEVVRDLVVSQRRREVPSEKVADEPRRGGVDSKFDEILRDVDFLPSWVEPGGVSPGDSAGRRFLIKSHRLVDRRIQRDRDDHAPPSTGVTRVVGVGVPADAVGPPLSDRRTTPDRPVVRSRVFTTDSISPYEQPVITNRFLFRLLLIDLSRTITRLGIPKPRGGATASRSVGILVNLTRA
jgi:hypothetical protein